MPAFTPPTVLMGSHDHFFGRYRIPVGQSVVRINGDFQAIQFPWIGELEAAGDEGTDWFLGGHTYEVSDAVAIELAAAGFDVEAPAGGYGLTPYGMNGYGV